MAQQLDHPHDLPYSFAAWKCRACNLRGRRPYRSGSRGFFGRRSVAPSAPASARSGEAAILMTNNKVLFVP